MWTSSTAISLTQAGNVFNVVGVAIAMLLSMTVVRYYPRPYFKNWTVSYVFFFSALFLNLFAPPLGHPLALSMVMLACHVLGTLFLFKTGFALSKSPPLWMERAIGGLLLGCGEALLIAGHTIEVAVSPTLLANLVGHVVLGWTLMQLQVTSSVRRALAGLSYSIGLWGLTFPLLVAQQLDWAGFVVAGLLHLLIGLGMALFLFEMDSSQLKLQNIELRRLDELKSNFVSTVSHELRTPLSAIKSAIWLLAQRRPGVSEDELIDIITNQSHALHRLVDDLLDFAKLESGALSYHKSPVVLDRLAQAVMNDVTSLYQQKDVELVLDFADGPLTVYADGTRLSQVLTNLLSNALKFTPPGGRVVIHLASRNGEARVEVEDTGPGIDPDQQARIFDRFYQVDNSSTRKVGGAGLGLAISKAIVEEGHQGKLWVESTPGQGSTFVFTLPLKPQGALASASGGTR